LTLLLYIKIIDWRLKMNERRGWQSKEAVEHFRRIADVLVPGRKEILSLIAGLATIEPADHPKILDLACGYGEVTAQILALNPDAEICMVDYSDEMLNIAKDRFINHGNVRIVKHNLNLGIPPSVKNVQFDSVVSCIALHHVDLENRTNLYSSIEGVLKPGGLFINGDRFKGDSPAIDRWEFDNWISWIVERIKQEAAGERPFDTVKKTQIESDKRLGDKPGTILEMMNDLVQSGFQYVDCIWKHQNLGILVASKYVAR
jgi:tRNA (cmo5U34)-methyltransferase